jgi:signal peptidase I
MPKFRLKKIMIPGSIILTLGGIALAICLLVFVKAIRVPTGSMANTIVPGDHLIVFRTFGAIGRGDVVMFAYPKDPSVKYVGRVVGLPRETIEVRDRSLYVNGTELSEQKITVKPDPESTSPILEELSSEGSGPYRVFYFARDEATVSRMQFGYPDGTFGTTAAFRIPDDQYFVMGDNRDNSLDSRFNGAIPRNLIWGKPTVIYWSQGAWPHEEKVRWERISKKVH